MTKADIINRVSEELGIDRRTVGLVIESFMKCVKDALGRERSVFLRGIRDLFFEEKGGKEGTEYPTAHNHMHPGSQDPSF